MATKQEPFRLAQNQKSGVQTGVLSAASIVSLIAMARAFGWEPWPPEEDLEMGAKIAGAIYVVGHIYGSVVNWVKNRKRPGVPTVGLPIVLLCAAALTLQGCASMAPAVRGKTTGSQTFEEIAAATYDADGNLISPETRTIWKNEYSVPAGGDVKQVASMHYSAEADDSWDLNISGDSDADTRAQAEMMGQIAKLQQQAVLAGISAAGGVATAALPIAGGLVNKHMDIQAAQAQTNAANEQAMLQQFGNLVDQKFDQILPMVQEQQSSIQQLRQQIVQQGGLIDRLIQGLGGLPTPQPATP